MKWINLKQNKCPSCDKPFGALAFSKPNYVNCPYCDFLISHKRYQEIVNSQVTASLERKWEAEQEGDEK